MNVLFRKIGQITGGPPGPGEIIVHLPDSEGERRALALHAVEHGLEGWLRGAGPPERIVVRRHPALDDMLAATFLDLLLAGEPLPAGARALAEYAALAREGLRPGSVPLTDSLEGIFLAIGEEAGPDLCDAATAARFLADWQPLAARILAAGRSGLDPFKTPLLDGPEFARPRAYLCHDEEVYRQDVARGQRWLMRLPDGPARSAGLLLRSPKSLLFKDWCRTDPQAPGGAGYLFLAVQQPKGKWTFSTDRVQRVSLKTLAKSLQAAQDAGDPQPAADDPWFDGQPYGHTMVVAPHRGTWLPDKKVLAIVKQWGRVRPVGGASRRSWLAAAAGAAVVPVLAAVFWPRSPASRWRSAEPDDPGGVPVSKTAAPAGATLHVLAVGITTYHDPQYSLRVAAQDAQALTAALHDPLGCYEKVDALPPLIDGKATKSAIFDALRELRRRTIQLDAAIVLFSGHGETDEDGNFYFLPYEYDAQRNIRDAAVSRYDIVDLLSQLPSTVILVLDACHSGAATTAVFRSPPSAAVNRGVRRDLEGRRRGTIIMAAAMDQQSAEERPDWGHGALTLALLEAIGGQRMFAAQKETPLPDTSRSGGLLNFELLNRYVSDRVRELTGGRQAVTTNHSGNLDYTTIAIIQRNAQK